MRTRNCAAFSCTPRLPPGRLVFRETPPAGFSQMENPQKPVLPGGFALRAAIFP